MVSGYDALPANRTSLTTTAWCCRRSNHSCTTEINACFVPSCPDEAVALLACNEQNEHVSYSLDATFVSMGRDFIMVGERSNAQTFTLLGIEPYRTHQVFIKPLFPRPSVPRRLSGFGKGVELGELWRWLHSDSDSDSCALTSCHTIASNFEE